VNIYVIYKEGVVINATPVPRVVIDGFKQGADKIQLWRNDKLIKTFTSLKEFTRFVNPRPSEDDDTGDGGNGYDW
jgi:hypothetical protein